MKKITLLFLTLSFLFLPLFVSAQGLEIQYPEIPGAPLPENPTLPEYIRYIYNFSIIIAGLLAFFSLAYGGFRYLISAGSPVAMADARGQITAGFVGLIILFGSYLLLVIMNPQLALLRIEAPSPEIVTICGNNRCELGEFESCPDDCQRIELATQTFGIYEIPIGTLIKNVLEPGRLITIARIAEDIVEASEDLVNSRIGGLGSEISVCSNSCAGTFPAPPTCPSPTEEGFSLCIPPPICTGDVCPNSNEINDIKEELLPLAEDLATVTEPMLFPLTSLKRDTQRLFIGIAILRATINPLNYDGFLETKQIIEVDLGGEVRAISFIVLSQRIPGLGDPATFYTDEERIAELLASGRFPVFPQFNTLATCNECQIDIHFTDFDIPETIKAEFIANHPNGKITDPCPGGLNCWDYVIQWAKDNGWNPAFLLALWGEESAFSTTGIALGCDPFRINTGTSPYTGDIAGPNSQLDCFADTTDPDSGNCQPNNPENQCYEGNTDFCGFLRCWSGGTTSCTLSDNPDLFPVLFDFYNRLIPTDPQDNPAAPSGNCTLAPAPLPPGVAGCPLEPDGFSITSCWNDGRNHRGIDLAGPTGRRGSPIFAVFEGVAFALGNIDVPCGISVDLQTEFGTFRYCHLLSYAPGISFGDTDPTVFKGKVIGFVDDTGSSRGHHLHLAFIGIRPDGTTGLMPIECLGIQCIEDTGQVQQCINEFAITCQ